jgi:hypothetical protein
VRRVVHILAVMFKLTRQEQLIVAFLVGALLLGTVVKEWRARRAPLVESNGQTEFH